MIAVKLSIAHSFIQTLLFEFLLQISRIHPHIPYITTIAVGNNSVILRVVNLLLYPHSRNFCDRSGALTRGAHIESCWAIVDDIFYALAGREAYIAERHVYD